MAIHLSRPSSDRAVALLARSVAEAVTYAPTGCSVDASTPAGLRRHRWATPLVGADPLATGRSALETWAVHRGVGMEVLADGPLVVGTTVAISARVLRLWVDIACRVVRLVDEPDRFGFAYGTLPTHPEVGEEAFLLIRDPATGECEFVVEAVSRPAAPLGRAAAPVADRLQTRSARRYLAAMRDLVSATGDARV